MKKRLLYLSAFLFIAFAFAACSDDEDTSWKEIPSVEISGENAAVSMNGQVVKGSIQFSVQNAERAELKLNNIVRGFEAVSVDVTLMKKSDGSFDFSGEKVVSGAQARAENAVVNTVKVNGNVTMDGKVTVEVKSELSGGITANWFVTDTLLFDAEETKIEHSPFYCEWNAPNIFVNGEGSGLVSVQIAGLLQWFLPALLTDALHQVNFGADGNITAKYYSGTEYSMDWIMNHMTQVVPTAGKTWVDSPADLAYWYVSGDKLFIVPNIGNIIAQVSKDNTPSSRAMDFTAILETLKGMSGAEIKGLLAGLMPKDFPLDLTKLSDAKVEEVIGWLSTGIPLNYSTSNVTLKDGKQIVSLRVYLDKDFVEPFTPLLFPLLPVLDKMMQESAPDLYPMLSWVIGLKSLTEIEGVWKGTKDFKIGVELADKTYK